MMAESTRGHAHNAEGEQGNHARGADTTRTSALASSGAPGSSRISGEADRAVDGSAFVGTLEGVMRAQPGDFIIKGVQGEFYPCKPDIFAATYERAIADALGEAARAGCGYDDCHVVLDQRLATLADALGEAGARR